MTGDVLIQTIGNWAILIAIAILSIIMITKFGIEIYDRLRYGKIHELAKALEERNYNMRRLQETLNSLSKQLRRFTFVQCEEDETSVGSSNPPHSTYLDKNEEKKNE